MNPAENEAEKEPSVQSEGTSNGSTSTQESKTTKVTYNWVDISDDFVEACEGLKLGELCHDSV